MRLRLRHGPIDLIIEAWGNAGEVEAACALARQRFDGLLEELVAELPMLRAPLGPAYPLARGPVARRMVAATWPHRAVFITPMASVAGAVADEILAAMLVGARLDRAYVNNGGDIAVHVAPGEHLDAGIVNNPLQPALDASLRLERSCGLATSGWRGRSQSLGIADAVTVLADSAALADAAATLVANAVNVDHPRVHRRRARELREDSDLGDLPVTVEVGSLPAAALEAALDCGFAAASNMQSRGLLQQAYLALGSRFRVLPVLLALAAIGTGAQAQRVEMLYLSTPDCGYCRTWESRSRQPLLDSPAGRAITFVEVRGETLRKPITLEHYPRGYAWAYDQVGPSRGVPRFLLFVEGRLVASAFGLTAYEREFLPALNAAVARPATSAKNREQRSNT